MSLNTQAKLLRVLQEKYIHGIGRQEYAFRLTRVCTTHRDLETRLKERQFQEDLYYRLNVVVIRCPPLRQRTEDIPNLVKYFLQRDGAELGVELPSIQPEAIEFLQKHQWPGNVRELENMLRQTLLLAGKYTISLEHVRRVLAKMGESATNSNQSIATGITEYLNRANRGEMEGVHGKVIEEVERELFAQAIQLAQGNQAKAARWLGVSRITMREKLNHFGLHPAHAPTQS